MTTETDLACLIDFGSTYTKVVLADLDKEELIARHQSVSTVKEGIVVGLRKALAKFSDKQQAAISAAKKIACSSAAGGLQVVVVGLVPELTVEAARRAALGAGAKIVAAYPYELTDSDVEAIAARPCDLLLLTGGIDGGNERAIVHNAAMLARSKLMAPFVVAGNRSASGKCEEILRSGGQYVRITENILPQLDKINVGPARALVREIFMERIVRAKGLDKAQEYVDGGIIMPTPMATLKAGKLLSEGADEEEGMGKLVIVEIGGATTNVHSLAREVRLTLLFLLKAYPSLMPNEPWKATWVLDTMP
ncbi:MAG: glutamate mutase L [Chloroflexi bacterium]|nr:glutamate mutase L [Chloroflexota bacterium]